MRKKRMNAAVSKVGTVFNCRISRNVKLNAKNTALQFWRNIMVQKNLLSLRFCEFKKMDLHLSYFSCNHRRYIQCYSVRHFGKNCSQIA